MPKNKEVRVLFGRSYLNPIDGEEYTITLRDEKMLGHVIYRVKGEQAALRKQYPELIAMMELARDVVAAGNRVILTAEEIVALVPSWKNVLKEYV